MMSLESWKFLDGDLKCFYIMYTLCTLMIWIFFFSFLQIIKVYEDNDLENFKLKIMGVWQPIISHSVSHSTQVF